MITPTQLVDAALVSSPAVTADGSTAMYLLHDAVGDATTLWSCSIQGEEPRQVAADLPGIESFLPAPEGTRVAIVAGNDTDTYLVIVDPVEGQHQEIVRVPRRMPGGVASNGNGIFDISWSPDGGSLVYTTYLSGSDADRHAYVEARSFVRVMRAPGYKEDGVGALPSGTLQVMLVDVASGVTRRVSSLPRDHGTPVFSPDGSRLAVRVRGGEDTYHAEIVVYDLSAQREPSRPAPALDLADWASWSPDGERLAICSRSSSPASPHREIFVVDVEGGDVGEPAADLLGEPLDPAVWVDDRTLLVHVFQRVTSAVYRVNLPDGRVEAVIELDASHEGFAVDRRVHLAVQVRETLRSLGALVVIDLEQGRWSPLVEPDPGLSDRAGVASPTRLQVALDLPTDVWLLRPATVPKDEPLPTVFALHGGPAEAWGGYFVPEAFLLASHGFQVAMPNLRGSSGYGRAFMEAEQEDYGGKELDDLMSVVDVVASAEGTDASRLGIMGGSHGGYLTAWTIAHTDRFSAAVCACPVIDLASEWATSDAGGFWGDLYHGGSPWERPDYYAERSPSTVAHRIRTPTLIVHGEDDDRCPVGQSEQLFSTLHRAGCMTELVVYAGASHGFAEAGFPRAIRVDYFERMLAWFDRHLRA